MEADTKKIKARDRIKDFAKSEFNSDFDALNDSERSVALLKFYVNEIHNKTRTEIDDEQFDLGLVDGAADLGIDFIHKDDQLVTIIQSKYRGVSTKSEDAKSIIHFKQTLNRLIEDNFQPNKKLVEYLNGVDFKNDQFRLIFITTAPITGDAKIESETEPAYGNLIPDIVDRVTYEYLDENQLNIQLRNALSIGSGISDDPFEISAYQSQTHGRQILEAQIDGRKQCVMAVEANQLINLHNKFRDRLFNLNIRNFIGNTDQNKKIGKTIKKDPSNFFFFNNGISCLSKGLDIDHKLGKVTVRGLQIINGAQTVKSLVLNKPEGSEIPVVLMRITSIDEHYSTEKTFIDSITRFNNSQNVVKISDFRSNDPVQVDIQDKFSKINLQDTTKKVIYLRKRTDEIKRNQEVIRFEEFCKALHSFLIDPVQFSSSTSYLFDDSDKGGYAKIFGDGTTPWEAISDQDFEIRAAIWWLAKNFEEKIRLDKKTETDNLKKNALQGKWLILYAARCLLERSFGNAGDAIRKHYKSGWKIGEGEIGKWYQELYSQAKGSVVYLYLDAEKNKGKTGFLHRNWLRSSTTAEQIKNYCENAPIQQLKPPPSKN
jgi:hypothetical protein